MPFAQSEVPAGGIKTYKREFSAALLIFWAAMTVWGVFNPEARQASEFMLIGVFGLAAGAFGMDSLAKQFG